MLSDKKLTWVAIFVTMLPPILLWLYTVKRDRKRDIDEEHARSMHHNHEYRLSKIEAALEEINMQITDLDEKIAAHRVTDSIETQPRSGSRESIRMRGASGARSMGEN